MARHESDREDLLRQATALVERAELSLPGGSEAIVVGFRKDGSASFFFGADPVYQFNAAGQLRRAYLAGLLYKAERGRLIRMRRERSRSEVALVSVELSHRETDQLLAEMQTRLAGLAEALGGGEFVLVGEHPPEGRVVERIKHWLATVSGQITIAPSPRVG